MAGCGDFPRIAKWPAVDAEAEQWVGNSMRVVLAMTASVFLFAADGSALAAASCSKGMLWPYVRNPGDCLTDAEITAGQTGVYNGPVNTNPDVAGIHPVAPVQNAPVTGGKSPGSAPTNSTTTATRGTSGTQNTASIQRNTAVPCHKGALWPFVRSAGDCLTDVEKKEGQTGVFGGGAAGVTPVSTASVSTDKTGEAPAPSSGAGNARSTSTASNQPPATAPEPACRKGLLWPFVRRDGDCPTDTEKKRRN